ncbi:MAG: glycosyltransferase [Erysipelothrix sp.]|jgi:glycosyltransferase involved in cell wall biosynthesis|nr:glycosyltransferase [Erysipelothrix sp.]
MHILILSSIDPIEVNGIAVSVPSLSQALRAHAHVTHIDEYNQDYAWFLKSFDFSKFEPKVDMICFQEVYKPWFWTCAKQAQRASIPYIITPRVSLTIGAQNQRAWKKRLANLLFVRSFVRNARALHFLNEQEAKRSISFDHPHQILVGNGVKIPQVIDVVHREKVMLMLVRKDINHKGLDLCVQAVSKVAHLFRQQHFEVHIHGSDYRSQKSLIQAMIDKEKVQDIVKLLPAIHEENKMNKLHTSRVILLTSRFEGHPQGLLEGLAYGCVGIASTGSNVATQIEEHDAGYNAQDGVEGLVKAFKEFFSNEASWQRQALNAHAWMKETAHWDKVSEVFINELKRYIQPGEKV